MRIAEANNVRRAIVWAAGALVLFLVCFAAALAWSSWNIAGAAFKAARTLEAGNAQVAPAPAGSRVMLNATPIAIIDEVAGLRLSPVESTMLYKARLNREVAPSWVADSTLRGVIEPIEDWGRPIVINLTRDLPAGARKHGRLLLVAPSFAIEVFDVKPGAGRGTTRP